MKKRHPAAVLLLPIVTIGIYCVYWAYATRKELVARTGDPRSIPPVFILFLPLVVLAVLAAALFIGASASGDGGSTPAIVIFGGVVGVISVLAALAVPLWWFWRYCRVAANTARGLDFTQLYVLYVVISWFCGLTPVWMLLVQMDLNKLIDREAAAQHPANPGHHTPIQA